MNTTFEINNEELSGFGLCGWVHPSGVIQIELTKRFIKEWPKEIFFHGNTYTLENVINGNVDNNTGLKFQNAEYM